MGSTPLVSIIIPTYNRADLIGKTLNSVIAQNYTNWECIVVDDGSTDTTVEVIETYSASDSRIKNYKRSSKSIKGAPSCRNFGIEKSSGTYVIFLDSDDYLLSHCLENRVEKFIENSSNEFLVFPMGIKRGAEITKREIPQSENYLINFLKYKLPWQTMCPIWKTSFLKELGGFTEGYSRLNDPELHIRAIVLSNGNFKVFNNDKEDCVYEANPHIFNKVFADRYYETLFKFIPEISIFLNKNQFELNHFLSNYFYSYLNNYSKYNTIKESFKLVHLFNSNRVLSFLKSMFCILLIIIERFLLFSIGYLKSIYFKILYYK